MKLKNFIPSLEKIEELDSSIKQKPHEKYLKNSSIQHDQSLDNYSTNQSEKSQVLPSNPSHSHYIETYPIYITPPPPRKGSYRLEKLSPSQI